MALFSWKKSGPDDGKNPAKTSASGGGSKDDGGSGKSGDAFTPEPEKANVWFNYAKAAADSSNYEYALTCYANGIKLDPERMSAHEGMYEVSIKYMNAQGKPATGREISGIEDSTAVSKFAAAEFAWMKEIGNASLALKALETAIKAGQMEYGNWVATRVFNIVRRQKKPSKKMFLQSMEMFEQVGAWNEALAAGQLASQLDPTDNVLAHRIKDISAQRAMDQGGYDKAGGAEGGFRTFIKDADRQRELQDSEAIAGNLSTEERQLLRAQEEYEKSPGVPDVINRYAQLVKKKGTPQAEEAAYQIYTAGFEKTGEYRFRMAAGDIRIEQRRREYDALAAQSEQNPADESLKAKTESAKARLLELEAPEIAERVAKYTTDRTLKLRLGEVEFARGNLENAMGALQAAKEEPKLRVRAGHLLGKCFAAEGWHNEAISEYKEALAAIDVTEKDRELAIRYDLMNSLIEHARQERSVDHAREALEICSGIARKNITYRDIRNKRKEVDQLIRDLTGGGGTA